MRTEVTDLREQAADPSLGRTRRAHRRLPAVSYLEGELGGWKTCGSGLRTPVSCSSLPTTSTTRTPGTKRRASFAALRRTSTTSRSHLLNGEYDVREALISINSQAGGADAEDFRGELQRMYLRGRSA